ncbi:hypothetical protein MKW98_008830 [Papaver atlanticum]|uniref:Uncharacterized protein n=1 Tax=Papaver atlanticum TaxID=357466 RepID=A0AAD4S6L1_9MAGN|nr:hypothetical protein MKW98_008830 [Papaver atlanticum]
MLDHDRCDVTWRMGIEYLPCESELQDDASSVSHSDSCPEEYESDDDIVYFSRSCTLEIKGDTDESEDEDEPEDADDDENVKDEVLSQGKVDEGTDPEFDSCRPEKPSQEAVDKLEEFRALLPGRVKI